MMASIGMRMACFTNQQDKQKALDTKDLSMDAARQVWLVVNEEKIGKKSGMSKTNFHKLVLQ